MERERDAKSECVRETCTMPRAFTHLYTLNTVNTVNTVNTLNAVKQ